MTEIVAHQSLAGTECGALVDVDDRAGGTMRMPGAPWRFRGSNLPAPGVPTFQGEHNAEVLREYAIDEARIESLACLTVVMSLSPLMDRPCDIGA